MYTFDLHVLPRQQINTFYGTLIYVYYVNQLSKDINDTFRDIIRLWRTVAMWQPHCKYIGTLILQ